MTFASLLVLLRLVCGQTPVTAPPSGNATLLCFQADPTQFRVDFTTTPPTLRVLNLTGPVFVTGEVPTGAANGTNIAFVLANAPLAGSEAVYRNGVRLLRGGDYSINGTTITFTSGLSVPQTGDLLQVDYRH